MLTHPFCFLPSILPSSSSFLCDGTRVKDWESNHDFGRTNYTLTSFESCRSAVHQLSNTVTQDLLSLQQKIQKFIILLQPETLKSRLGKKIKVLKTVCFCEAVWHKNNFRTRLFTSITLQKWCQGYDYHMIRISGGETSLSHESNDVLVGALVAFFPTLLERAHDGR